MAAPPAAAEIFIIHRETSTTETAQQMKDERLQKFKDARAAIIGAQQKIQQFSAKLVDEKASQQKLQSELDHIESGQIDLRGISAEKLLETVSSLKSQIQASGFRVQNIARNVLDEEAAIEQAVNELFDVLQPFIYECHRQTEAQFNALVVPLFDRETVDAAWLIGPTNLNLFAMTKAAVMLEAREREVRKLKDGPLMHRAQRALLLIEEIVAQPLPSLSSHTPAAAK